MDSSRLMAEHGRTRAGVRAVTGAGMKWLYARGNPSCEVAMRIFSMTALLVCSCFAAMAADRPAAKLAGIPEPLEWQNAPQTWSSENGQSLSITAGGKTDWFIAPTDGTRRDNSPRLLFRPGADFVLSARLTVDTKTRWNGGALVVYAGDALWAKLALETTVEDHPAIVSVVTNTVSDDANSIAVNGSTVYLRIAKAGPAIFFYASQDGKAWQIIRAFSLGETPGLRVGFSSQSPLGEGCTTVFDEVHYAAKRVNLWTGE